MPKRGGKKNKNNIIRRKEKQEALESAAKKELLQKKRAKKQRRVKQKAAAADSVVDDRQHEPICADEEEEDVNLSKSPNHDNKKLKKQSDVSEGRTVFIRNLSFNSEEEDISSVTEQFGQIEYCLLCRDKDTGQSRGTAFVKFVDKSPADACVAAENVVLDSRPLKIDFALEKSQVDKMQESESRKEKDKRNLYLLTEGWIRAGTDAAAGVSTSDLQKRDTLMKKKRLLLKLLTNFVSKTRLCIHNLPPDVDDKRLRSLFLDAGGKGAVITECRVMRNRLANGKFAGSKGFAFVQFTEHDHALRALRKLNNNPTVFSSTKRPIVEFSIENKFALNKLKRRAEKQAENPNMTKIGQSKKDAKITVVNDKKKKMKPHKKGKKKIKKTK